MLIYLVRHGQTDWNAVRRIQGRENIPLNEKGRQQAVKLAESFKDIMLDGIVSSPLDRAVETASVIASEKGLTVDIDKDLIERDYGDWSGHVIRQEDKKDLFRDIGVNNMEPASEVEARMKGVMQRIAASGKKSVLCISHGAAINALLSALTGGNIGSGRTWLINTCINVIEADEKGARVLKYNLNADAFKACANSASVGGYAMGVLEAHIHPEQPIGKNGDSEMLFAAEEELKSCFENATDDITRLFATHHSGVQIDIPLKWHTLSADGTAPEFKAVLSRMGDGSYYLTMANRSASLTAELDLTGIMGDVTEASIIYGRMYGVDEVKTFHGYRGADEGFAISVLPQTFACMHITEKKD